MKRADSQIECYLKKLRSRFMASFVEEETSAKDIARIEISSRLLQMSELSFFHLAYQEWFGDTISDQDMEDIYTDYLFMNEVPLWVSDLARNVLSCYFRGYFDTVEYSLN
jgi:hypothetical protein